VIDLHCHILPGIDDGARSDGESLAIASAAGAAGVTTIVATPHIDNVHGVDIVEVLARVGRLNRLLAKEGIPVEILPGGEVAVGSIGSLSDDELSLVSLGGPSRWILLESPFSGSLAEVEAAVDDLVRRGFRPLLAHPERCAALTSVEAVLHLVERGVRVQVNAASLLGEMGGQARRSALSLVEARLVHVVSSDAHRVGQRLGAYLSLADRVRGNDPSVAPVLVAAIRDAPEHIIAGADVAAPMPRLGRRSRSRFAVRRSG